MIEIFADAVDEVAGDEVTDVPAEFEALARGKAPAGGGAGERGLEMGAQIFEVDVDLVRGTVIGEGCAVAIEDFAADGRDTNGAEGLADLAGLESVCGEDLNVEKRAEQEE
jgi:hypothetical protein